MCRVSLWSCISYTLLPQSTTLPTCMNRRIWHPNDTLLYLVNYFTSILHLQLCWGTVATVPQLLYLTLFPFSPLYFTHITLCTLFCLGILWTVDDTAPPHPFIEALQLDNIGGGHSVELFMDDYFGHIIRPEYFSYPGSLTMPPCSEIVNWFIVKKPETLTTIQLQKFKQFSEFRGCGNNRLCQPIGARHVCMGNCDYILDYEFASSKAK